MDNTIKNMKNEDNDIKTIFNENYPYLQFDELKKQKNTILTNDACCHFLHPNNQIYSWNFVDKKWLQHNVKYQDSLIKLKIF
jgi:hypothetical protein